MIVCTRCGHENAESVTFCERCDSYLEWTGAPAETPVPARLPQAGADRRPAGRSGHTSAFVADLEPGEVTVEPGARQTAHLQVKNTGQIVDELHFELLGDASPWCRVTPATVSLMPGDEGAAELAASPPRHPNVAAGTHDLSLLVRSRARPDASVELAWRAVVGGFDEVATQLRPQRIRARRRAVFELTIENRGNRPVKLAVEADEPEGRLELGVSPASVEVAAGSATRVLIRVTAPTRLSGPEIATTIDVTGSPPGGAGPTFSVRASLVQLPTRLALLAAAMLAIGALAVGAILLAIAVIGDGGGTDDPSVSPSVDRTASASVSPTPSLSPTPTSSPTPSPTPSPMTVLDRLAGDWTLERWTEAGGPVSLGIEVLEGTLTITGPDDPDSGLADWRLDIQERNEPTSPQPAIRCGGQVTLSGEIQGEPGGARNGTINWTADLRSIDRSSTGENRIFLALCGWATIGTRAPFAVVLDGDPSLPAVLMEMTNEFGTLRWSR